MCFKQQFKYLSLLVVVIVTSSCGLVNFSEEEKDNSSMSMGAGDCLSGAGKSFSAYIEGSAKEAQVRSAVTCVSDTLRTFATSINGEDRQSYTISEIKYFVDTNLYKDEQKTIAESLVRDVFRFKASIIGGDADRITKSEFKQIADIFDSVAPDLVDLNPDMKILSGKWTANGLSFEERRDQFNVAGHKLNEIAAKIFGKLNKGTENYQVDELMDLMKSIATQFGKDSKFADHIESYRPLALQIKSNLISQGGVIKNKDWPQVGFALSKVLEISLIGKYFNPKKTNLPGSQKVKYLGILVGNIFDSISRVMDRSKIAELSPKQMFAIMEQVIEVVDDKLTADQGLVTVMTLAKDLLIHTGKPSNDGVASWDIQDFKLVAEKIDLLASDVGSILLDFDDIKMKRMDYVQFESRSPVIQKAADRIRGTVEGSLDLKHVDLIITEVRNLGLVQADQFIGQEDQVYAAAQSVLRVLTGDHGTLITNQKFKSILYAGMRAYLLWIEYDHYLKPQTFGSASYLSSALPFNDKLAAGLKDVMSIHPQAGWQTDELVQSYQQLLSSGVIDTKMSAQSVGTLVKFVLKYILNTPSDRLSGKVLPSLNAKAVDQLQFILKQVLSSLMVNTKLITTGELLTPAVVKSRITTLVKQLTGDTFSVQGLKEIYSVVDVPVAMTFDNQKEMQIATGATYTYNEYDLRMSTLARSISWLLIRSFSQSTANINTMLGVTAEELETVFKILYPPLVELDVIPPNEKFMSSRFTEMNLFAVHANGDNYANYNEIHDVVLHLLSGTKRASHLVPSLLEACNPAVLKTYNRFTPVDLKCSIDFLYKYKNGFDGLPDYLNFKKHNIDEVKDAYYNILLATGFKPESKVGLTVDSLQNFPHAVQYIEMLFEKYDKDHSGSLNKDEALAAFPTFKQTISDVLKKKGTNIKDKKLPGVFIYFLKYGQEPATLPQKIHFLWFISKESRWDVDANRHDVAKVFSFLSQPAK